VRVVKAPDPAVSAVILPVFAVNEPEARVPIEPLFAKSWVVEATPEAYRLVVEAEPKMAEVAKRFVEVVFVPVALVQVRFETASAPERVRFAMVALVAPKFVAKSAVEVALVLVTFVKTPVDGVVAPIVVPLIDPPEIVALEEINVGAVSVAMLPEFALMVVPLAVVKPNQDVEVPFPKERFAMVPFVMVPLVVKKFVEVVLVPVAFVQVMLVGEKFEAERFVKTPFVANRLVVVTLVPVAFVKVRPWREEAPETVRAVMFPVVIVAVPAVTEVALMEPIARFVPVALRKVRSCKEV
jgi:hypothetical protein